jgi:IS1 family transposase
MAEKRICGDTWAWVAIDTDTKLVPCWLVGIRGAEDATKFIAALATRISHRVQLTTDGYKVYLNAVIGAFAEDIDYAQFVKIYGSDIEGQTRYSPAVCVGTRNAPLLGDPDPKFISTSYAERQNLTMRIGRRRLTNGFSKKIENHDASVALHFIHYNFARVHQTLRVTPAMEAGVSKHAWSFEEIATFADQRSVRLAA